MYALYKESYALAKFDEHSSIYIDTDINDIRYVILSNELSLKLDGNKPIAINKGEFID
jgi:hypothetical protein